MEPCFTSPNGFGGLLGSMELKNTYLPIYYDAWLYDHHDDPLMSRRYEKTCDSVSTKRVCDESGQGVLLSAFIPIIAVLSIKDEDKKSRFMRGDGSSRSKTYRLRTYLHGRFFMLCYMYIDTGAGAWTRRVAIHMRARPMQGKKRRAGKMGSLFFLMWPPWEPTCFLQRRRCPCSSSRWFFCWWLKSRHCSFGRGAVGK